VTNELPGGVTADFMILCDAAQVQGDKLSLLGGGWSMIWARQFPTNHQMAVAAGILVPWMDTNQRHEFRISVRTEDGASLGEYRGSFEQGRPAGLPAGSTQRVLLAVNFALRIEREMGAVAELWLDDAMAKSVPFRVIQRRSR
jgi:hypothetical protein